MIYESKNLDVNFLRTVLPNYFGEISDALFAEIQMSIEWFRIERGEVLFRKGDVGDSMYILMSGRLQVSTDLPDGSQKVLGYVMQGESVGEMALITGEHRSATVRAMRASILIKLPAQTFHVLARSHPELLLNISRDVIFRLRRSNVASKEAFTPKNIMFVQASRSLDLPSFMHQFREQLDPYASSRTVSPSSLKSAIGSYSESDLHQILSTLNRMERKYDHILFSCPYGNLEWLKMCALIADRIYIVVDFEAGPELSEFEEQFARHIELEYTNIEIIFCHAPKRLPEGTRRFLDRRTSSNHYHLRLDTPADFGRMARLLSGKAVALVLGGGGARGFAHLGVYQALVENGVPVDLVCGASAGSMVAGGISMDNGPQNLVRYAKYFNKNRPFSDITFPIFSLLRGRRMNHALEQLFHGVDVEDCWINFFTVASNITKVRTEVLRTGPVWRAVRASLSLPVVLPPMVKDRDVLIDGGIVNNLPVDVMKLSHKCRVIGVNVGVSTDTSVSHEEYPTPFRFLLHKLLRRNTYGNFPNFFSIILRLTTIASASKLDKDYEMADIMLMPPVAKFGMIELEKMDQIVKAGYDHTIERMADIKAILGIQAQGG